MQKLTVSRNDDIYEAFPDIAQAQDGTLICTYRECMTHAPWPFSRVVVRRSEDGGYTWYGRQVLIEKNVERGEGSLNCPRIVALSDGTLLLVVDFRPPEVYSRPPDVDPFVHPARNLLFRSSDGGQTWEGPEDTGITDGIVPALKELSNGDLLLGLTRQRSPSDTLDRFLEEQTVYRSSDRGLTWEGPFVVPGKESLGLNEGDFAELDDGTIVLYMREDREAFSGWKSLSSDGGITWSEPSRSPIFSCRGRPSVGRLRSGEIAVTYRFCSGVSTSLALYVETPAEAVRRGAPDPGEHYQCRCAFLDNDRSLHPDSGYSGWVQLPSGDLYVVNYVTDDAPRAYIRGYLVSRHDWFLFPEGSIPQVSASSRRPSYVEISAQLAREQHTRNLEQASSGQVPTSK